MKSLVASNATAYMICSALLLSCASVAQASPEDAAQGLTQRIIPQHAASFIFATIPQQDGKDVFEIESQGDRIMLRGSNGVAMASALNHYLNHFCNASVSLQGTQLNLPESLPRVDKKIRIVTPFQYRYCFNYCCFSYSMAWWDWEQWERTIDWMALHGINMPLAVTGQEATWRNVYREMGLTDEEIAGFIVGPAYLPFGWMGCIDSWGGPLPNSWIDSHEDLQKKIVARERELGMTPVLQGFTGHVPKGLQRIYPDVKFEALPEWVEFPHTWFVDPQAPLFTEIGKRFIEEQRRQYGTNHLYAADTFIEMPPPDNDPVFLAAMAKAVHGGMTAADPDAIWVMQGWLFVNAPQFWKAPQAEALLTAVPDEDMIVLDLACEWKPTWSKTNSFYNKPWIWCIIQNYGNKVSMHGGLPQIHSGLNSALKNPERGQLSGAGMIMEGLGYNPVVHDLVTDMFWQPDQGNLNQWVRDYPARRYGAADAQACKAWELLHDTAYRQIGHIGSILTSRPNLGGGGPIRAYSEHQLAEAWERLLDCADAFKHVDAYQYDVVHVGRQVLLNKLQRLKPAIDAAYKAKQVEHFEAAVSEFRELIIDIDALLGTREEFLLGAWLEDAKRWATTDEERRLYEWNARNQITLWGDKTSRLHYYANKQWSGMLEGYYLKRWDLFFDAMRVSINSNTPLVMPNYPDWEDAWTHETETYPAAPQGDAIVMAQALWKKYRDALFVDMKLPKEVVSLTTDKPATCSFSLEPYPALLANDGMVSDTDQYWATDTNQDEATWWQVDLQKKERIGRIVIVPYFGDDRRYGFEVETSTNAKRWRTVADYTADHQPATREGTSVTFEPRPVRYIRITFTHNSANTGRHLVEVMAYEK